MTAALELLAFSSLWVAAAAVALCAAAGRALGSEASAATLALAASGTVVVYTLDRLRDTDRDRHTAPRRTRFVERWQAALMGLAAVAALASGLLAALAGPATVALLAPVAALGLAHRRLKRFAWWKPLYVTGAWTAVVVGLPALSGEAPDHVAWVVAVLAPSILSNAVASNLRDLEAPTLRFGPRVPLHLARALAIAGLVLALLAPAPVRPLALVPGAVLAAALGFRPGELYGMVAVDGALLAGGLAAWALLGARLGA